MFEAPIHSTFVSEVAPLGFADAAEAADELTGHTITAGRASLDIHQRIGAGLAGAIWYSGRLRTGSRLIPSVKVEVVISPWSAERTEIGLRPRGRLERPDSLRANRFFDAAWAVVATLIEQLAKQTVKVPDAAEVKIAA